MDLQHLRMIVDEKVVRTPRDGSEVLLDTDRLHIERDADGDINVYYTVDT